MPSLRDLLLSWPDRQNEMYQSGKRHRELGNSGLAQQLDIGDQQLETGRLAQENARAAQMPQQFRDLVGTLGGGTGGRMMVQQNPGWSMDAFGSDPKELAQGPPNVRGNAEDAGRVLYNTGPEVARQLNLEGSRLPLEIAKIKETGVAQAATFNKEVPGRIQIAEAGFGANAAEHAKNRSSQAAGVAMQNFLSSRPISTEVPLLESTAASVKTADQAATLIHRIGALKAQVAQVGESSMIIGQQMGANPSLLPQLQKMTSDIQMRLDNLHRELYNRYYGAKPTSPPRGLPFQNSVSEPIVGP